MIDVELVEAPKARIFMRLGRKVRWLVAELKKFFTRRPEKGSSEDSYEDHGRFGPSSGSNQDVEEENIDHDWSEDE